jgi:hypothetical protein
VSRMLTAVNQVALRLGIAVIVAGAAFAAGPISIKVFGNTPRETQTTQRLRQLLVSYDLSKYTFTRTVMIEEDATDHAFPALTLNTGFAKSPDELLSALMHEQLHWFLQEHRTQTEDAIKLLRRFYPRVPVGETEGAPTIYSTYVDLIVCYLEIQADRHVIGEARTLALVRSKSRFPWIYKPASMTKG